ncbi:MAG TPA: ArsI/CadI family heavy metal resistance metalloenzyme [Arenibaculum sp.]|nr:ArsI/CadI family heavy metal resistance metalloenzyme [Arenibaculum sp.]
MATSSVWEHAITPQEEVKGVAEFTGDCRLHISLNVADLRRSVEFYRVFFGTNPAKVKEGYAKFDLNDPAINFSINEFPEDIDAEGHLGIQLKNTKFIREAYERFKEKGFKLIDEDTVECCYAVQSKFWVADPDGHRWEMFVTTEPEAEEGCGPDCICHAEFERTYTTSPETAAAE